MKIGKYVEECRHKRVNDFEVVRKEKGGKFCCREENPRWQSLWRESVPWVKNEVQNSVQQ